MPIAQALLTEFEHESQTTRKFLQQVPQDKLTWKPHEKSHTAGGLAFHIATCPGFVVRFTLEDQSPIPAAGDGFPQPATVQEILAAHDQGVQTVREILPTLDDARLMTPWTALKDGKPVLTFPKMMIVRVIMLNHIIHHRGQLGVYLRLLGAKVPSAYGPSGDEG
jgi:uncharacterized damage-inducible protein DinB